MHACTSAPILVPIAWSLACGDRHIHRAQPTPTQRRTLQLVRTCHRTRVRACACAYIHSECTHRWSRCPRAKFVWSGRAMRKARSCHPRRRQCLPDCGCAWVNGGGDGRLFACNEQNWCALQGIRGAAEKQGIEERLLVRRRDQAQQIHRATQNSVIRCLTFRVSLFCS